MVPSASKIKERKKSRQQQLFRPRFQSGFVCHQQSLSFSDCARKSSIATKKTTHSHTRYNSKEKCLSQFPPLLAPESSPRRTSAPLPPREEPPRCKSSRKENYGGFACFFFSYEIRKRKRASARFRALVTSISIDLSNRANAIVVGKGFRLSKPVDWVSHLASFRAIDVRGNISAFEWEDKDTLVSVSCSLQKGKKARSHFFKTAFG